MSEIKNEKGLIPFVSRVVVGYYRECKKYPYISNIAPYLEDTAKTLGIDLEDLTKDLTLNLMYYYSDPKLGAMKSTKEFSHVIDDSRKLWLIWFEYDKSGKLIEKGKQEVWIRSDISLLFEIPFSEKKVPKIFKARTGWGDNSGRPNTIIDTFSFYPEPDSSSTVWGGKWGKDWRVFTTEEEADICLASLKDKPKKEKKVKTPYDDILKKAEELERGQIEELIKHLESLIDSKIDAENLNPLEIALEYKDKAKNIDNYIIPEGSAIRDWVDKHRDPHRYETIEYYGILDWILDDYPEGTKWEDIKEDDQEVISEIAECLRCGEAGFKWDW